MAKNENCRDRLHEAIRRKKWNQSFGVQRSGRKQKRKGEMFALNTENRSNPFQEEAFFGNTKSRIKRAKNDQFGGSSKFFLALRNTYEKTQKMLLA